MSFVSSMNRALTVATVAVLSAACASNREKDAPPPSPAPSAESQTASLSPSTVSLNGEVARVRWSDGDTFRLKDGAHKGTSARLSGFNTLEDYGPVHRWGSFTKDELFALAKAPEKLLAARGFQCRSDGQKDGYGRLLVECPDAAMTLVSEGLAMVFAVEGVPDETLLASQQQAIFAKKGIWEKGVPSVVVTSLHSLGESESKEGEAYNRVVDTKTGIASVRKHQERYETCQEVCEGGDAGSCMTYVPYERRYKKKPDCLR